MGTRSGTQVPLLLALPHQKPAMENEEIPQDIYDKLTEAYIGIADSKIPKKEKAVLCLLMFTSAAAGGLDGNKWIEQLRALRPELVNGNEPDLTFLEE